MHTLIQSCVLFLWINTLTFVESQECTLEQFLNGPLYDSTFDVSGMEASYAAGKQIRVGCSVGFSGFFKLICVEGKWQARGTKCQPKDCGHPGDAPFSDFFLEKGEDFVFGSKVVYKCHTGYQMVSRNSHRNCMDGGWDGLVPVCEAQQCPVIHVKSNVQVIGDPEEATFGNVIRFTCKSSSDALLGVEEVYCNENGEWSGKAPECKEINCPVPMVENGRVLGDKTVYKEGEVLHYACDARYMIAEHRPSMCTKIGIRAEWSITPACELIKCKLTLPPPRGTTYEPENKNIFIPGDKLRVTCEETYWITTPQEYSVETTCQSNGKWSDRPVCLEVVCRNQRPEFVKSWNIYWGQTIRLGDTASYYCVDGYKRTGDAYRATCTRNGWRPDPLCEEITCDRYDYPNTDIIDVKDKYRYNERVDYVCKNGYEGEFYLYCRENNEWRGTPQCSEKSCKKLDISDAYIIRNERQRYRSGDRVQYRCSNDRDKLFTIRCEAGDWTGVQSCSECPKAEIPHGFSVGPHNKKLYYTCDEGYKRVTKGWWGEASCNDGVWSGLDQCIAKENCAVPVIPNGKMTHRRDYHEDGVNAEIVCEAGYGVQADPVTCVDGKWNSNGIPFKSICAPLAKPCSPPPRVVNAVVTTPFQKEYLSGSEVTYRCRQSHTIQGEATLACNDGKWDEKTIECIPVSQDQ